MRLRYKLLGRFTALVAVAWISPTAAQDAEELAAAAAAIPVEAFFVYQNTTHPKLSPDGKKIAYIRRQVDRLNLNLLNRENDQTTTIIESLAPSLDEFFWKGNQRLGYYHQPDGSGLVYGGIVSLDDSKHRRRDYRHFGRQVIDPLHGDPERIIVATDRLYFTSLWSGNRSTIFELERFGTKYGYRDFALDGEDTLRLVNRIHFRKGMSELLYRDHTESDWQVVVQEPINPIRPAVAIVWVSQDGQQVYLVSRHENDRGALYEFDVQSQSLGEKVFLPPGGEISGLLHTRGSGKFLGLEYHDAKGNTVWFDESFEELQGSLEASFPDSAVRILDMSSDEKTFLVSVYSDRDPGAVLVLDKDTRKLDQFRQVRPSIDPQLMRPQEVISFTASDGLEIQGYLTRPHSHELGEPVPLVVLTHRDYFVERWYWGFDPTVQFLASRGYAVLQVNHRGSGGFGRGFLEAGRYQLGRAMLQDLSDGVEWVVEQGIADPERVAIFGGYMALAGISLKPDEYACGVNIGGRADLEIAYRKGGEDAYLRKGDWDFRDRWIGKNRAERNEISPLVNVSRIKVPSFHAYKKNGDAIRPEHAKRLARQLKKHGKDHEFFIESPLRRGNGTTNPEIERYRKVQAFLAKHL